jgi:hypothetical protein
MFAIIPNPSKKCSLHVSSEGIKVPFADRFLVLRLSSRIVGILLRPIYGSTTLHSFDCGMFQGFVTGESELVIANNLGDYYHPLTPRTGIRTRYRACP